MMTKGPSSLDQMLMEQKVVACLRRVDDLPEIINHPKINTVFLLNSNIFELKQVSAKCEEHGKNLLVHVDLVEGLGKDNTGIRFLSRFKGINGIITTKVPLIKAAKAEGMTTVQRFFMVDSEAVKTGIKMAKTSRPDAIEILPAFLPTYYLDQIKELGIPVIAGGLLRTGEEVNRVLASGFQAVSTSLRHLWDL